VSPFFGSVDAPVLVQNARGPARFRPPLPPERRILFTSGRATNASAPEASVLAARARLNRTGGPAYPMLANIEREGYLTCQTKREGRTPRKFCSITDKEHAGQATDRMRVRELGRETVRE